MKRAISVLCLFAMLLSLAAVMTVSTSAVSSGDGRTATYTPEAPIVDAEMDKTYLHAQEFKMETRGTYRVLWDETGLYLFVNIKNKSGSSDTFLGVEVFVSGLAYAMKTATQFWANYAGDYYFRCVADGELNKVVDGTISKPTVKTAHGAGAKLPDGFQSKVKRTSDKAFQAEFYIPMKSNDWNISKGGGYSFVGLGLKANGNKWMIGGMVKDSSSSCESPYPYALKTITLGAENKCQFTVETEPTLIEKGRSATTCSICGKENPNTEIPATTIQWLGMQTLETLPEGATTTSMRLVSQIKDLDGFSAVGYEITASTGTVRDKLTPKGSLDKEMTAVYQSILAAGEKVEPKDGGQYLVAIVMDDIPLKDADGNDLYVSFTVKPYTKDAAGNKVYMTGTDTVTFVLKAGVLVTD